MITHETYYHISRTIRTILIVTAFIAAMVSLALSYAHVDLLDIRSHAVEQLEKEAQRKSDREAFHKGNEHRATTRDKERQIDAFERNQNDDYKRNCD